MAPSSGFEPETGCLTGTCSTAELRWKRKARLTSSSLSARDYVYITYLVSPDRSAPRTV